jgi:AsmA-like protein
LNATVGELTYGKLKMTDARGRLRVRDQRATLENFQMNTLGGGFGLAGFYETTNPAKPTFDVGVKMNQIDIPSAFQAFMTVQTLAPVAKYAVGKVTTDVHLSGALGKNMRPVFPSLGGRGTLQTSQVALHNFPPMNKIVEVTKLQFLNNPTLQAIKAAFQVQQGRLMVQPFDLKLGPVTMLVSGSNGPDHSLNYTLQLRVPRALLGSGANQALASLVSKAGQAGIDLNTAPEIPIRIQLAGSVTNPVVKADLGSVASSVAQGATQAVQTAAKKKVSAEATRLVQAAEQRAAAIRQQAQALADKVKQEGYQQADALTAKADNPILKAAAEPAAEQLRNESDSKAADIVSQASQRADSLVAAAQRQAQQLEGEP